MPPPPPPTPTPPQRQEATPKKTKETKSSKTCQKRKKSRACQRKCDTTFLYDQKTLRLPRKMDVLKFIGGRRSKCIFLQIKNEKNAFRLHETQISNVTNDDFSDGETAVLWVYIYIYMVYIYIYGVYIYIHGVYII